MPATELLCRVIVCSSPRLFLVAEKRWASSSCRFLSNLVILYALPDEN